MYQYEFAEPRKRPARPKPDGPLPASFLGADDIVAVRAAYWAEHCLECGEPECYSTCEHFVERADGRCKRFAYGMVESPDFPDAPYAVEVSFRKWAKMESIVYPGSLTFSAARDDDRMWSARCAAKRRLMGLGALGRMLYPVSDRQEFDSSKYQYSDGIGDAGIETPTFLLQVYSHEDAPVTLFLEITDDEDVVHREGVVLQPGYNRAASDVAHLFPPKGRLRAKVYPEDNAEITLTFLFCGLVALSPAGRAKLAAGSDGTREAARPAQKVKCVAWDLDDTVWNGVFIESDPAKLELRPGVLDAMRALDDRGIVQISLSKNTEAEVLPTLERLGIAEYFVLNAINWDAKSANLSGAADTLNINIDTFALIDDSAFERGEVEFALPMVRTFDQHSIDGGAACALLDDDAFDVPVTPEGKNRRAMYRTEAIRMKASGSSADPLDFLRSCELTCIVSHPDTDAKIKRSHELLQRTNQLNLSGTRYDADGFSAHVERDGANCWVAVCEDRFGGYGQVLYLEASLRAEDATVVVSEYALSCRVAHKYLESALAAFLLREYADAGAEHLELRGKRTDRNGLLIDSFGEAGFEDRSTGDAIVLYLDNADRLVHPTIVSVKAE